MHTKYRIETVVSESPTTDVLCPVYAVRDKKRNEIFVFVFNQQAPTAYSLQPLPHQGQTWRPNQNPVYYLENIAFHQSHNLLIICLVINVGCHSTCWQPLSSIQKWNLNILTYILKSSNDTSLLFSKRSCSTSVYSLSAPSDGNYNKCWCLPPIHEVLVCSFCSGVETSFPTCWLELFTPPSAFLVV